jgi:hypothetical protein
MEIVTISGIILVFVHMIDNSGWGKLLYFSKILFISNPEQYY